MTAEPVNREALALSAEELESLNFLRVGMAKFIGRNGSIKIDTATEVPLIVKAIEALSRPDAERAEGEARQVAWSEVVAERQRQVEVEKRSSKDDDDYANGELAKGAVAYALSGSGFNRDAAREMWPWSYSSFKPKSRRRDLVRAAALILAEIERLDRAAGKV